MSLEPWAFAVDCCRGDFFRPLLNVEKNSVRFLAFGARVCSSGLFFPLECVGERGLKESRGEVDGGTCSRGGDGLGSNLLR